jgi:NADPH:quinone reductase-like Zn-dependent oxidoreductase
MKAIQYKDYGNSDVIEQVDIPVPSIESGNDVLVQVKAAGVNPVDIKIGMGFMKAVRPVEIPFIPGGEAAGIIAAVGDDVSTFKVGDEVITLTKSNAYAEYVSWLPKNSYSKLPNLLKLYFYLPNCTFCLLSPTKILL